MNRSSYYLLMIFLFFNVRNAGFAQDLHPERKIWYSEPAEFFESSLPLGNGRIGAVVYGGSKKERIGLNESTLWAGGPVDPSMNPEAYKNLPEIREALFNEDYKLADQLVKKLQGKFSESYLPLGDIFIDFKHEGKDIDYRRELDIRTGIASINYKIDQTEYKREYFVSYPDQVLVMKFTSRGPDKMDIAISAESQLPAKTVFDGSELILTGKAPIHAEPNYRGNLDDPIVYDHEKGMRFHAKIKIHKNSGHIEMNDATLQISGTDEIVVLVSIATSYNGINKEPGTEGLDESKICNTYLANVATRTYQDLRMRHTESFTNLFNRVEIDLGESVNQALPTDIRLQKYASGDTDHDLEALYFQFGRYLLISSSRSGGVPANLQGIWNPHMRPPWSSNYTANINAQMNYWPAEVTNLSELHEPLLQFIGRLQESGRVTAQTFYGSGGWCCSHNTDLWAMTNPVGDFGQGDPVWANWSMAGPWYSTHLFEHFRFTLDTAFLKDYAYPIMKGAAEFCLDFLVSGPGGFFVTAPSTSPENLYITDAGYRGATLYGGTADLGMIREHLKNTIEAANCLGYDDDFINRVKRSLERLYPYQVGRKGNLQEWYYDWEDADPEHRHVSHLFGLYPGSHINSSTRELMNACKVSLELRGDGGTGWSKAWKINLWARLKDGNHAYKMLKTHLQYTDPSPDTQYHGGGTYPNLWDAHPPFQIDGNFGGTAGIAEMLLQSHENGIDLLPALPDAWLNGHISGLKARGGYEVDMTWTNGKLVSALITPAYSGKATIRYDNRMMVVDLSSGIPFEFR